jgi:ClpX C4-type zinc finger
MDTNAPPPVLSSARVIAYALVDDQVEYTGRLLLVNLEGQALGRVPRLAICENLADPRTVLLLHCDDSWNVLGLVGAETVDSCKREVERTYRGIGEKWNHLDVTREAALAYYDSFEPGCSFCGKRTYEVGEMIQVEDARICRGCVEEFYKELHEED